MIREIPEAEFHQRIERIQKMLVEKDYDAYLVHSNEADHASVRYLSDHWPIFETAGVIIPKEGDPILLIGPEAEPFAIQRSKIKKFVNYLLIENRLSLIIRISKYQILKKYLMKYQEEKELSV